MVGVKLGKVTGAQLQAFWESEIDQVFPRDPNALFGGWLPRVAGMKVLFRADAPLGHHVASLDVNGKPLDRAATYTLASCEREGDAPDTMCRMKHVADAKAMTLDVHPMLRDWPGAHDPVSAPERRLPPEDRRRSGSTRRLARRCDAAGVRDAPHTCSALPGV
jgi:sulfur-oxidizing protein SoxB